MSYYPRRMFPSDKCPQEGFPFINGPAGCGRQIRLPFNCTENFQHPSQKKIVIVHMNGCGPCRYLLGEIQELIKPEDIKLVESRDQEAEKYSPEGYPTIVVEDINGRIVHKESGARSRKDFELFIQKWKYS